MIKQRTIPRKLLAIPCALAFLLGVGTLPASASVIDAPHNETNNVKCGDCHTYSLWWQYSPAAANPNTPYAQITNGVCNKCHAPGGWAPNKIGHTWESMADIHDSYLGNWETKCIDCHNPHYQDQLSWLSVDPALSNDLYLATGTIVAGSIHVNGNTTTLSYKNADAHLNWLNPATWTEKSTPGRGLILLITDSQQNTFEINATTESTAIIPGSANGTGTLTLQGSVPSSYNATDTNFAIIYGQLLRKTINTPHSGAKDVKFFDASLTYAEGKVGGSADPVTNPPQGICQVCHTNTKYYNSDGLQPDRNNPTGPRIAAIPHNTTAACTGCHSISLGFRPTNADHTFISNLGTTCANCHDEADIITGTHRGNCTDCHEGTPPALKNPFPSPKWPTAIGQPRTSGTCYDCHSPIAAAFTAHPKALDHTGQVDPYPNCTGCHFHSNKDVVADIHNSDRDHNGTPDGSPCSTCHSLTYDAATGTYSGSGALISRAAQYGPGNCTNCHRDIAANFFVHPKSNDHSNQVTATPQCANCHNGDPVNDVHNWSCGLCHQAPSGLLKGSALAHGPGDCMNCHNNFYVHTNADALNHSVEVTGRPECVSCHSNPDLINGLHGRLGCATCHDQYGTLVGSASGHNGGGDCATCHTTEAANLAAMKHPSTDHSSMNAYVTGDGSPQCTTCHSGDPVEVVHNKNCLGCHLALNPTDIHTLIGSAAGHGGHQVNTCTDCHTAFAGTKTRAGHFDGTNGATLSTRHMNYINGIPASCLVCHTDSSVSPNLWLDDPFMTSYADGGHQGSCYTCHLSSSDLTLIGSASGKATGKPLTSIGCTGCHTKFSNNPHQ